MNEFVSNSNTKIYFTMAFQFREMGNMVNIGVYIDNGIRLWKNDFLFAISLVRIVNKLNYTVNIQGQMTSWKRDSFKLTRGHDELNKQKIS